MDYTNLESESATRGNGMAVPTEDRCIADFCRCDSRNGDEGPIPTQGAVAGTPDQSAQPGNTDDDASPSSRRNVVTVLVNVPGGDPDARFLSFQVPGGLDPRDLLESGFAIDGGRAVASIHLHPEGDDPFDGPFRSGRTVIDALRSNQHALVEYLEERGYEVRFA